MRSKSCIRYKDETVLIPQSHVLLLLDNDKLVYKEYYSCFRPLNRKSFGISNPEPAKQGVDVAIGGKLPKQVLLSILKS